MAFNVFKYVTIGYEEIFYNEFNRLYFRVDISLLFSSRNNGV